MSGFEEAQERDMVLFVGSYLEVQKEAMRKLSELLDRRLFALVLIDITDPDIRGKIPKDNRTIIVECDFSSHTAIQACLAPYNHRLLAVTTRQEKNIALLRKTIPHVPYVNTPTELSLEWATDKIKMRQMLRGYDKNIAPKFLVVHDGSVETLDRIEKRIGFPVIIKPAGLDSSLLVSICYYREELEKTLKTTVRKINQTYKKKKRNGEPQVLVEEYMDGTMYSIDSYVNQRGVIYHMPLVHVKTGHSVGFEDFFNYYRITPVLLKPHKVEAARKTAEKAIEALGLRSTTAHIELMKTEDGWKVIELGPRIGGFRHDLYRLAYGIDHSLNDILIRIPKKPLLTKKVLCYTVALKFYPPQRGRLKSIGGINKIRKLESYSDIKIYKKVGEMCDFASKGDEPVFDIVLSNKVRSKLLADIRRVEQTVDIVVSRKASNSGQTKTV
ncbi:MAG TPA: ATP-grasp domain-containing protein [Candidatus Saccharimonadales bacterium]|nr:ATP-grasp domain-containing protein [Candidatus Saccharimonadales bacterium]